VDYVGVAFGGEPLASVFMNRSFDCNVRRTKAQQSENSTGTVEPLHWNEASILEPQRRGARGREASGSALQMSSVLCPRRERETEPESLKLS
jgi:hypothetical protein